MTWTKTSDDYTDDCWTLTDAAYRLHHEGLTWSNRKLLDCVIPLDDVRRFAKCPDAVDELLAAGFWTVTDDGDAYRIVHHAGYQPTREYVLRRQAVSKVNGKAGGRPRKTRERPGETQQVTHDETQPGSQPGFKATAQASEKPSQEPGWGTQHETQGDGTGRDGKGSPTENAGSGRTPLASTRDPSPHACAGPGICRMPGCSPAEVA